MAELAVKGCTVSITSGQTATAINITTQPSSDVLVSQKGVYFGDIDVSLTAVTVGTLVCASATLTISGTAGNILDKNGNKAIQKGDNASDTFTFTDSTTLVTTDLPIAIQITDAGQSDVKAL